jgi:hypothetical protein
MPESTNEPPDQKFVDSETALGGADAVEKTTYVVGQGTTPEARTPKGHPPEVGRTGPGLIVWVIVAIAVIVAVAYLAGMFTRTS